MTGPRTATGRIVLDDMQPSDLSRAPRDAVRDALQRRQIRSQPLIAAVSGGADSVALLELLLDLRIELGLEIIVAHFDHRLRPGSGDDANWVRSLAAEHGITCEAGQSAIEPPSNGLEAWARQARYAYLEGVASRCAAAWIAVAHTADDQAETVLHHILRGTGLKGLAGMPATRRLAPGVRIIRPLLSVPRADLRNFLAERRTGFRQDETNLDPRWTRNAIRQELLPLLQSRFNPHVIDALRGLARHAADASRLLRRRATACLRTAILERSPQGVRLRIEPFEQVETAIAREAAVALWQKQGWPRQRMVFRHWALAAELLQGRRTTPAQWPGGITGRRRGALVALDREDDTRT